jgi:hypothetical protein
MESKNTLSADDMMVYVENSKESLKIPLRTTEFSTIAGFDISTYINFTSPH